MQGFVTIQTGLPTYCAERKTRLVPFLICDTLVADNFVTKEAEEL